MNSDNNFGLNQHSNNEKFFIALKNIKILIKRGYNQEKAINILSSKFPINILLNCLYYIHVDEFRHRYQNTLTVMEFAQLKAIIKKELIQGKNTKKIKQNLSHEWPKDILTKLLN